MRVRASWLALFVLASMLAFAADAPDFTVQKIADGVYAALARDGSKAGSNATFVVGHDAVLVVDTFQSPDAARELLAEIKRVTPLPVRYVINTHYHLDHTAGNGVFAEAGAVIFAQRNVRDWVRTENLKFLGPNPTPEAKLRIEALVRPQVTYPDAIEIDLGGRMARAHFFPGHTGGDSVVFIPDANVLIGGDLLWEKHFPNMIDATSDKWIGTLDTLIAHHRDAIFVSGHGGVMTLADVRAFRSYLVALRGAVKQAQEQGKSGAELEKQVTAALDREYGEWAFKRLLPRNIEQTAAELKGQKRVPTPAAGE